ncbi:rhomboid family intramembrane serine protease [Flavobacterium gawalongense]|uniref:Rhomboid family intramembrane serine protease n=1 Tax=Flavobacterium gawalongense TaxID=2594432 RepID=A0A553BYC0_9FLAO|nr:rhomboid family intramembrane serine protease [Flavobacterium gawalongense]TRX13331.1 rhomboid family intramembrane serine protease [Flavobacterium gawalongense]TRX15739.1 rhomboid family intramembrane serine protease [Flavobacterium gawalongense]TRX31577.1 rhomboid family intramembrane serine protease [Flavobacterium gawalongense]
MDNHFKFTNSVVGLPLFFVVFLWFVFWLEIRFDFDFVENGIYPRELSGLQGVLFSPFIHGDIEHLYNNSIPLLILLAALQFFYANQSIRVIGFGILLSGIITWVIGRDNYHIGASGLVYVLVSFIFFKGIQTKYYRLVALSLAVIVIYGGLVWYAFPSPETSGDKKISWEGHLAGLITGFALSLIYKTPEYKKLIKYDWEKPDYNPEEDPFMQRFDANGNFMNLPKEETIEELVSYYSSDFPVDYTIVLNEKNESKPQS